MRPGIFFPDILIVIRMRSGATTRPWGGFRPCCGGRLAALPFSMSLRECLHLVLLLKKSLMMAEQVTLSPGTIQNSSILWIFYPYFGFLYHQSDKTEEAGAFMSTAVILLLLLSIALSGAVQIFTDPRITRKFVRKSVIAIAVYAAHIALGALVLFVLIPHGPNAALGVTLAFVGWVGLGVLGLIRFAPRLRTPPSALLHFGFADALCLLAIGAGIVSAIA